MYHRMTCIQARVSLARIAYSQAEIVLLDDPLSAIDAYVGQSILNECLLNGPLAGQTRILATHALHVLHKTDYIYVMENGTIVEEGTYDISLLKLPLFVSHVSPPESHEWQRCICKLDGRTRISWITD